MAGLGLNGLLLRPWNIPGDWKVSFLVKMTGPNLFLHFFLKKCKFMLYAVLDPKETEFHSSQGSFSEDLWTLNVIMIMQNWQCIYWQSRNRKFPTCTSTTTQSDLWQTNEFILAPINSIMLGCVTVTEWLVSYFYKPNSFLRSKFERLSIQWQVARFL